MSLHAYSKILLHIIWGTKSRDKTLNRKARTLLLKFLNKYCKEKDIYIDAIFVNPEHIHLLIDLPTDLTVKDCVKLLKGSSSYYINKERLVNGKFSWGRGYAAFSVSESQREKVRNYIKNQEKHHRIYSFEEEFTLFIKKYNVKNENH